MMLRPALGRITRLGATRPILAFRPSALRPPPLRRSPLARQISTVRRKWENLKIFTRVLVRKSPFESAMLVLIYTVIVFGVVAVARFYMYNLTPTISPFPKEVADFLRKAIYYSELTTRPDLAAKYYKQALLKAEELGIDGMSDEMLGLKIRIAAFLEKYESHVRSIELLEQTLEGCLTWLDEFGKYEKNRADRTRILQKVVRIHIKLGDSYSSEFVNNFEAAERHLVLGLELALRELDRRQTEGIKEDEGDWTTNEELGGAMETLGHFYESKSRFSLATPLFLRALTLSPPPCHAVILMNNLASCLAQTEPHTTFGAPTSRPALIADAVSWAEKALFLGQNVAPPERTEECDIGCAVATHNLGEFAEMQGLVEEARKKYVEASSLAEAIGFQEGVQQAKNGLRRLKNSG